MSEKKKSLPKELIKKENTAKKPGSPKAKGFHTVDIKLERLKEKFKIHEEDRIIYKDSKVQTGGQVIRFGKCKDKQKAVRYLIIAHLDIDSDNNRERKFYFPDVFSNGYMKKELLSEKDKNFPAVQPVFVVEKETGKDLEKQTVSCTDDSKSAVKVESPGMSGPVNPPARNTQNPGIDDLLSEIKQLVYEIRGPLQETFQKQEPHLPSDEQTGPSEAEIKIGDLVWHKKFGKGTVTKVDNEKDSIYIKIHFEKDEGDYPAPFPYPNKFFKSGFLTKGGEHPAATESSPKDAAETAKNANTTPDSGNTKSIENPSSDLSSFRIGDIIYQNYWGWGYINLDFNSMKMYLQFDTSGRYTSPEELQDLLKKGELFTRKELEDRKADYLRKAEKVIRSL